jgi:hypothetical protein
MLFHATPVGSGAAAERPAVAGCAREFARRRVFLQEQVPTQLVTHAFNEMRQFFAFDSHPFVLDAQDFRRTYV